MVKINPSLCKSCGYCIKFCPKHILEMGKERNRMGHFYPVNIDNSSCTSCGICATICPDGAIEILSKEDN